MKTIKTEKGQFEVDSAFIPTRLNECDDCTPEQASYNCLYGKCPVVLYGLRGFGTHLPDFVCDCPHHSDGVKEAVQSKIDSFIENEIDFAIEG